MTTSHGMEENMDGQRFDDLTRRLAGTTSRRQMLKGLAGGLGAAIAATLGQPAAAQRCENPKSCSPTVACCPGSQCIDGVCQNRKPPKGDCKNSAACGPGESCCGGTCVSLDTVANCGSCGNACAAPPNATASCVGGQCQFSCIAGFTLCNGTCIDTQTDVINCGSCGNACGTGRVCSGGQCICDPTITCTGLAVLDETTCQCVCPHTTFDCPDPLVFNATTCACEGCPEGKEFCVGNQSCVGACAGGRTLNQDSCACECPSGQEVCPATDACVEECPAGQYRDPNTCQCKEGCGFTITCGFGSYFDTTTCECRCVEAEMFSCTGNGSQCCPNDSTCCLFRVPGGAGYSGCCPPGTTCCTAVVNNQVVQNCCAAGETCNSLTGTCGM